MKESFEISEIFAAKPAVIYNAWLSSKEHSKMTGGEALCSSEEGGEFTAWNEYIWGANVSLTPCSKIVQTWRTTEFSGEDEDSVITVLFEPHDSGCCVTIKHTNLPQGQTQYLKGWKEHYFEPMREHFSAK